LLGAVTGVAYSVSYEVWFFALTGWWFVIAEIAPTVGAVVGATLGVCLGLGKARGARPGRIGAAVLIVFAIAVLNGLALLILSSIGPE
jgi:hypothetical protein